ncbi:hypothetical protein [Streptococcus sp. NLN76]|uniref:hypothetical protein n=1 Tax=Streptococcus sp. NLN76 TaxID=2822800 RepID=UPI0018AC01F8|nr:hypothetical protein [Streptococcus sp. NLN76]MBF8970866.1 hypothetical protein [Streptococcus sp. NLN76]
MTGKEWSDAFKKIEGREPSPQEFMEAKKAGFPELVVEKSGGLTAAQWTEAFTKVYNRNPSPQEFMAAKTQGFPAIVGPEVDEELGFESQTSPSEEIASQPAVPEDNGTAASEPEEPVTQSAQSNTLQEEPVVQPSLEFEVTEEVQPVQAIARPEEATVTMGTSQTSQEPQPAANQNPQQTSTGLRILRVLAMIAIVLLTIALAVILGYFALGPLLEMLG